MYAVPHLVVCPQTQCVMPRAPVLTYSADVLCLLDYHQQELTLDYLFKILKQSAIEEAEESESELKKRTMRVLKVTECYGFNEAGISVFEDTDWNEQRAAVIRQGMNRVIACYEEIVKVKNSYCLASFLLDFFKSSSVTCALPHVLLDIGDDSPYGLHTKWKHLFLK